MDDTSDDRAGGCKCFHNNFGGDAHGFEADCKNSAEWDNTGNKRADSGGKCLYHRVRRQLDHIPVSG